MDNREEWVATRAYQLWESAGRPEGQHDEHWKQASYERDNQQGPMSGKTPSPATWDEDEE